LATGDPAITARLRAIERAPADLFVTCPPQVLEFAQVKQLRHEYIAPSSQRPADHGFVRTMYRAGPPTGASGQSSA
ncbi:MAG: hypothetical protein QM662_16245, partial [Gordonia sp. (in: high G+C Gram-positive bacteria)]